MTRLFILLLLLAAACTGEKMAEQTDSYEQSELNQDSVIIKTSVGDIEILLDRANAPITVDNFLTYVDSGFYKGTVFHRVIPGFMIQGGGFTADGSQKPTGTPIPLENPKGNVRGTIAMARTMIPDSATSQFFINLVDNRQGLDAGTRGAGYAVFGRVVAGMDVADEIAAAKTGSRGPHQNWPVQDVIITDIVRKNK